MKYPALLVLAFLLSSCAASLAQAPAYGPAQEIQASPTLARAQNALPALPQATQEPSEADKEAEISTRASNSLTAAAVHDHDLSTQISIQSTAQHEARIFEGRKPTLIVAMTQAGFTAQRETAQIAMSWGFAIGIALIGLGLLVAILRLVPAREQAQRQAAPAPPAEEPATPARFSHYEQTPGPYPGEMQLQGIPATLRQMQTVAHIVAGGENPSVRNCTPLGDGDGFSRTGFNSFADWMERQKYADSILANGYYRGLAVTEKGRAFLKAYEVPEASPSEPDLIPL